MPVKIRLARHGRRKNAFYHIVVADARAPRDGKFIQKLGIYDPMTKPATIELDREAAFEWFMKGAQPTDTARAILRFKGIYYKKHLQRGVSKGALSQEEADSKFQDWVTEKEAKVEQRRAEEIQLLKETRKKIADGIPKSKPAPATEEIQAFAETSEETTQSEETEGSDDSKNVEEFLSGGEPESVSEDSDKLSETTADVDVEQSSEIVSEAPDEKVLETEAADKDQGEKPVETVPVAEETSEESKEALPTAVTEEIPTVISEELPTEVSEEE